MNFSPGGNGCLNELFGGASQLARQLYSDIDRCIAQYELHGIAADDLTVILSRDAINALRFEGELLKAIRVRDDGYQTIFGRPFLNAQMRPFFTVVPNFALLDEAC